MIKAHTHSSSWKTVYVHFNKGLQTSLDDIANQFNQIHNRKSKQIVNNNNLDNNNKENENGKPKQSHNY